MQHRPAILALEDGRIFNGRAAGAITRRGGEVVFNTSLTGYQEVFTDPSYAGQIVCLTYPHIGNVGANLDDRGIAAALHRIAGRARIFADVVELALGGNRAAVFESPQNSGDLGYRHARAGAPHPQCRERCAAWWLPTEPRRSSWFFEAKQVAHNGGAGTGQPRELPESLRLGQGLH